MVPNHAAAAEFSARRARSGTHENSANGRYGLLARGFGDGGLGGLRSEFHKHGVGRWPACAHVSSAAQRLGLTSSSRRCGSSTTNCDRPSSRRRPGRCGRHPSRLRLSADADERGSAWDAADVWERPRPQVAQWALSTRFIRGWVSRQRRSGSPVAHRSDAGLDARRCAR